MQRFNPFQSDENALPPTQVRFLDLHVEPWGDQPRVRVHIRLTPFLKPPNLEAILVDTEQHEVASVNIIENIDYNLVFTMHIRPPNAPGPYELTAKIEYDDIGIIEQKSIRFSLPEG